MAKRTSNQSTVGDVETNYSNNKLQPGMDQIDVRRLSNLMGNSNSYTNVGSHMGAFIKFYEKN
jgi:hypothetical protein